MNKARLLKIVNIILFLCALNQLATALLSDLMKNVFEIIHPLGGILFAVFAILHIILNWAWVKGNIIK